MISCEGTFDLRVAFFGSGSPFSAAAFNAVAAQNEIVAAVLPDAFSGFGGLLRRILRRRRPEVLTSAARCAGLEPIRLSTATHDRVAATLAQLRPDLIVVATFPTRLTQSIIGTARYGGLNSHQSLLPRGRGPDPLFWAYYNDDAETGTTVHYLEEQFDSGDVIAQVRVPIARGRSIIELYFELAEIGAAQLAQAISEVERGTSRRVRQDEAQATRYPSPMKTRWRVAFDEWAAERTWHFLSGVGEVFGSRCRDPRDRPLPMGRATAYREGDHGRTPGYVERVGKNLRLYCPDGVVDVGAP